MPGRSLIRKHIRFFGSVQGVGFRYRARHAANAVGATGWVHNEYDGTVIMEIQGTENQINKVILMIENGTFVHIDNMETKAIPIIDGERSFKTK